jgi:hypothetical protein
MDFTLKHLEIACIITVFVCAFFFLFFEIYLSVAASSSYNNSILRIIAEKKAENRKTIAELTQLNFTLIFNESDLEKIVHSIDPNVGGVMLIETKNITEFEEKARQTGIIYVIIDNNPSFASSMYLWTIYNMGCWEYDLDYNRMIGGNMTFIDFLP